MWHALCRRQLGVCFRRQVVLQGFIADFYASEVRLIVEVDGSWHTGRAAADCRRERLLSGAGYPVLRVGAQDVLHNLPEVLARIAAAMGRAG